MKPARRKPPARPASPGTLARLRARLAHAEAALNAIHRGEVDTVVVDGKQGPQVFTLAGAEHAYRVLIESMNEGALTLSGDRTILYANACFARMVRLPLEQVIGGSFTRFLSTADRARLRPLLLRATSAGSKIQTSLKTGGDAPLPAQISIRPLAKNNSDRATIGLVVTDMTEARRNEERLRALTQRVVQVQEAERGRVALELHDNISQRLIAVQFHSQALAEKLTARDGPAKIEAAKLRELLGQSVDEVERISRNLRPSVLDQLGLVAVLRAAGREFTARTGVPVQLNKVDAPDRLAAETELALYRIFQEALDNVERHAHARHVTVDLIAAAPTVKFTITDDGAGFAAHQPAARRKTKTGLGLLSMRERASYVGGSFKLTSRRGGGTTIEVSIPLGEAPAMA